MTPFASLALFRRNGNIVFKAPRKETSLITTQAKKSAARFWNSNISAPDKLTKIVIMNVIGQLIYVAERGYNGPKDNPWVSYHISYAEASAQPHLAACLAELGADPNKAPPSMPDTLEINGVIYRREI
ncbi:hypothetical protein HB779_17490 [Phyllobacterium sp. 628]|uniref:hypothetical protein n=1 Tax=Phyllobacterium sp. 628 TaxID=2718938 RepID=UPI00166249B7|nr:hypothetical protein [Phyllobacterium sp. 628]QND53481.1 hypothetical protein HB779_17490 [Phyllobacterium sp. 628]